MDGVHSHGVSGRVMIYTMIYYDIYNDIYYSLICILLQLTHILLLRAFILMGSKVAFPKADPARSVRALGKGDVYMYVCVCVCGWGGVWGGGVVVGG